MGSNGKAGPCFQPRNKKEIEGGGEGQSQREAGQILVNHCRQVLQNRTPQGLPRDVGHVLLLGGTSSMSRDKKDKLKDRHGLPIATLHESLSPSRQTDEHGNEKVGTSTPTLTTPPSQSPSGPCSTNPALVRTASLWEHWRSMTGLRPLDARPTSLWS